jgi:TRAP-type C4-dicarboxylate transport system permease small subunit
MAAAVEWLSRWCARVTAVVVLALGIALVACILISVFFRYIVGQALSWPEELSMFLFTWLVLLASSLGVREGFHVRLSIVFEHMPSAVQRALAYLITLAIIAFGAILIYSGKDLVVRATGHLSATIGYPLELINCSASVCGALIVVHALSSLLNPEKGE